jgi:hypothetical protein
MSNMETAKRDYYRKDVSDLQSLIEKHEGRILCLERAVTLLCRSIGSLNSDAQKALDKLPWIDFE